MEAIWHRHRKSKNFQLFPKRFQTFPKREPTFPNLSQRGIDVPCCQSDKYGYPLISAFSIYAVPLLKEEGVNNLQTRTELSDPSTTLGVFPNSDTLYSTAVFDLSAEDLIVTVPEVDVGRFWSFSFFDAFGDNFAVIGSIPGSPQGNYTLHLKQRSNECYSGKEEAKLTIESPVAYGSVLIRILVRNNGSDLAQAQKIIRGCNLTTAGVPHLQTKEKIPPLTLATFSNLSSDATGILQLTARTLKGSPPINVTDPGAIIRELESAGISNGSYHTPAGTNLTAASDVALAALSTYAKTSSFRSLGNGWGIFSQSGLFGSDFLARAYTVTEGGESEVPSESLYAFLINGSLSLASGEAYLFTFSRKPPLGKTGFWSITAYSNKFLIPNPAGIYAAGDRSNLTYPDGSLVYTTENNSSDKRFQLLIQSGGTPPPANWTHNWLPSPMNESAFNLNFRLYSPTPALTNGSWTYPEMTKISAIKA
jgi:hypothetical protein